MKLFIHKLGNPLLISRGVTAPHRSAMRKPLLPQPTVKKYPRMKVTPFVLVRIISKAINPPSNEGGFF
jgi:hypothetical protein